MHLTDREKRAFSFSRALKAAADGGLKNGLEAEILREATEENGNLFTPTEWDMPLHLLATRDLTAGVAGAAGGVGTDSQALEDVLRPVSATGRAGVQFVSAQGGNVAIPKIATSSTAEWLTAEGGALTPSDTVMTEKTATPHWVGSLKVVSHQMVKQIVDPDLLGLDMLREVASTIDAAVLAGSGASGEPQGILGATDVGTQAGSSLAWAGVSNMIKLSAEANGEPSAFIGPPAVRDLLGQREKAAGSGLIWSDGRIDGLPAIATTSAPAATLFCGDWSQVVVVVWDSLRVAVDDSTFFADGRYQFRVLIGVDVVIRSSAAFCTSSSIT